MRTSTRLLRLQDWTYEKVCKGRKMKVPPPNMDITKYNEPAEPSVFLGYAPSRVDETGTMVKPDPLYGNSAGVRTTVAHVTELRDRVPGKGEPYGICHK